VPIYPSLTAVQVRYILNDSRAKAVFVSTPAQAAKLASEERANRVIAIEPAPGCLPLAVPRGVGRHGAA
jgi:long-subunit acyl-CoA synthetase (AMP-forming)